MNNRLLGFSLFAITAATVIAVPYLEDAEAVTGPPPMAVPAVNPTANIIGPDIAAPAIQGQGDIEVVFVLDTTGSMSELIQAAKEKIWSIATTMASAQNSPRIKIGLVAYRDQGEAYVTKMVDLTDDLDSLYSTLMDFKAEGGGDTPEAVHEALADAVNNMSWTRNQDTYRSIFLVGDAPGHNRHAPELSFNQSLKTAAAKGIVVNTIQCGKLASTRRQWQQVAAAGQGAFFNVSSGGDAVAIATPFDKEMAELSVKLDDTRLFYGDAKARETQQRKTAATAKLHAGASDATRARRATYNLSKSGERNALGDGELVDDIAKGRVKLDEVKAEQLPQALRKLAPEEQAAFVEKRAKTRETLRDQMSELAKQRAAYLKKKAEDADGFADSLDQKLYGAIRAQAAEKGFRYEADSASF
ncbi:MAG: VWA domain-containing protein [Pseudomonadota bacterium]